VAVLLIYKFPRHYACICSYRYGFQVKLITTVFGNCSLEKVIKNVAKVRSACGLGSASGPPIHPGCEEPLIGGAPIHAEYFHGADGMGNNSLPDEDSGITADTPSAVDAIISVAQLAERAGAELTVLTLGPLTNIARAIQKHGALLSLIHRLVVIGGCGNARGNIYRTTEFNVTADPEAAQVVLSGLIEANKICTLVSWELTLAYSIPWPIYDELMSDSRARASRINGFLKSVCDFSFGAHSRQPMEHYSKPGEHFGGAVICDALALAVALDEPGVVSAHQCVNVEVELTGSITRGQTVVDWGCFDNVDRQKNCHWITGVNLETYLAMFRSVFDEEIKSARDVVVIR
jgi:purine nucleosidase